ncbi:MAG: GNAT family N-acetyltransferase [Lachnospiraceae bacterium]
MGNVTADRAWDIHPVTEADIEAYLDIYLNSYPAYKTLDEECRAHYRSKHLTELREDTQTRTMGLFEGGTLIATMKLILFSMNFFGVMQPACGVMALEVHPPAQEEGRGAVYDTVCRALCTGKRRAADHAAAVQHRLLPSDGLRLWREVI